MLENVWYRVGDIVRIMCPCWPPPRELGIDAAFAVNSDCKNLNFSYVGLPIMVVNVGCGNLSFSLAVSFLMMHLMKQDKLVNSDKSLE